MEVTKADDHAAPDLFNRAGSGRDLDGGWLDELRLALDEPDPWHESPTATGVSPSASSPLPPTPAVLAPRPIAGAPTGRRRHAAQRPTSGRRRNRQAVLVVAGLVAAGFVRGAQGRAGRAR